MNTKHITVQEAAIQADVSTFTINEWIKKGRVASVKRYGRRLVNCASLLEVINERQSQAMIKDTEVTAIAVRSVDGPASVFNFNGLQVRTVTVDGEPWVIAKDVAEILGYTWNGSARIAHVPEEWRGVTSVVTPSGNQEMHVLSEQGLYFFLARSDKPLALPFQKWIAGDVLPAIRKTGGYGTPARDPITEVDRVAGYMNQLIPAIAGRLTEITSELDAIKAAQADLDPDKLAQKAYEIETERRLALGSKRGELRRLVGEIVESAVKEGDSNAIAQQFNRYQKAWNAIHRHVNVGRIDDYVTVEQFDRAIYYGRDVLAGINGGDTKIHLLY